MKMLPLAEPTYPLAKDGVFWTLQGEGALRGTGMVFIRLAGCSIGCEGCDTDYAVAERVPLLELLGRVVSCTPNIATANGCRVLRWVWITGGEPMDHNLRPLIAGLRGINRSVALATSGTRSTQGLDLTFLSVSPHSLESWVQRSGNEVKIVPGLNGLTLEALDTVTDLYFADYFMQPFWFGTDEDQNSLIACRDYVMSHPQWRLTDLGHKRWGLK